MDRIKIGVTGSRNGSEVELEDILKGIQKEFSNHVVEIHHGDCKGVDEDVHRISRKLGFEIVIHPPSEKSKRAFCESTEIRPKQPFLQRNKEIVSETDILLGFPATQHEVQRSGTWATIRNARKHNKEVRIFSK
ncbi:hypothetical protein N9F48_03575 [Akkermansiaceae bacterium]|nr:hypothetical protein [Akkermansiaceae bacterium]MDC0315013.1 hypothetical protein [bacterium]MDA8967308.1 hypothetical protein [Akkermansiaceae bacterium]MDA8969130.1 hypothetical protein [Akkermansiaceae bacterium]MDB4314131.1 hypothetical protein [Akkermansiaceae bacterium]